MGPGGVWGSPLMKISKSGGCPELVTPSPQETVTVGLALLPPAVLRHPFSATAPPGNIGPRWRVANTIDGGPPLATTMSRSVTVDPASLVVVSRMWKFPTPGHV
jgi:hypothetical protein